MNVPRVIDDIVGELDGGAAELIRARVKFEVRPQPTPADLELGAEPGDRGLFIGHPVRDEDSEDEGGELFVDDDDDVVAEGGGEIYVDDDGEPEVEEYRPGGRIVIFTGNIKPLELPTLREVVMHEIAHFLGEDEAGAEELGFNP